MSYEDEQLEDEDEVLYEILTQLERIVKALEKMVESGGAVGRKPAKGGQ